MLRRFECPVFRCTVPPHHLRRAKSFGCGLFHSRLLSEPFDDQAIIKQTNRIQYIVFKKKHHLICNRHQFYYQNRTTDMRSHSHNKPIQPKGSNGKALLWMLAIASDVKPSSVQSTIYHNNSTTIIIKNNNNIFKSSIFINSKLFQHSSSVNEIDFILQIHLVLVYFLLQFV